MAAARLCGCAVTRNISGVLKEAGCEPKSEARSPKPEILRNANAEA